MFNNAGIMHPQDDNALTTEERVWDLTMDINVKGVWYGCKHAIVAMRKSGGGSIINTASFVALMGAATPQLAYTASKGAVLALTRELATVHARENIRFNSLCPGPIRTPLLMDFLDTAEKKNRRLIHVPQGRFGEAIEQAHAVVFLASDESSFVTGTDFRVDGGLASAYVTPEGEPTGVIPLSNEFIEYLKQDSIYLPHDGQPQASRIEEVDSDEEDTDYGEEETEASKPTTTTNTPHFPLIEQAIRRALEEYEAVFPKLNWSSPRDAAWISATQSLQCTSPFDVFLLLKSSDFIDHDLFHAFDGCTVPSTLKYDLILRKWYDLQPSMEFRCFVKNNRIIGISQRDGCYYPFLVEAKDDLEETIHDFFEETVLDVFPSTHYVFDVYIRRSPLKVYLVDFNPFSPTTDSLLYDWEYLEDFDLSTQEPEIRIVPSQAQANVHQGSAPQFATNRIPMEAVALSNGRSIAAFAEEFERAMLLNQQASSDSDDASDHGLF
ncbi:D123-domain-containing protein [Spinellus fusiger]|nr:D123-domain-containing protein [Spinellus fusiger]